jgi:Flp pilus assembly protein TadD
MSELKHHTVTANGIRMHVAEQGSGPLVLLCHGWPELWYSWRHQIPALAEAGYRVVAPDMRGYGGTDAPEDIAAYTRVLEGDPNSPLRHDAVGMLYLQDGRLQDAVRQFRESLRLNPDSAPTHYHLGIAFAMQRQYPEAMREYEAAVRVDPVHAEAHNNLGAMLHVAGRLDEAALHYRRALELRPDNVEARSNLGRLLMVQGKAVDAAAEFERALLVQPDSVSSLTGLAWIRATSADTSVRRPGQAVALAERARQLSRGQDPQAFDALAAGYAGLGEFDKAVAVVTAGIQRADDAGQSLLAAEMRERLEGYGQHRAITR